MSENIMPLRKLRRDVEKALEKGVKACRIDPTLIHQIQPINDRLKIVEALEMAGIEHVVLDKPVDAYFIRPPFPEEIVEFYKMMKRMGVEVGGSYVLDGLAYIRISGFGRELYAVMPVSSPPDPLGEPDIEYNGLRLYSIEKTKKYIEWCRNYIRDVLVELYQIDVKQSMIELENVMPRGGELGYMWLDGSFRGLEYFDGYYIVLDESLRSRGVKVIRIPHISYTWYSWIVERSSGGVYERLVAILKPSIAEEVESRWLEEKNRRALRDEFMERLVKEYKVSEGVLRIPFEKLLEIPDFQERIESVEKVRSFIEEYCDGLYLVNDWHFSFTMPSIRHPLKILYLYWLARNHGINADLVARRNNRSQIYVRLVRDVYHYMGWWSLTVKPKRSLKIEYQYNARIEDGCLLIICDDMFKA